MNNSEKNNQDVVLILKTKNQIYAEMVKEALENDNIHVLLKSATGHHLRGMLPFEQGMFDYSLFVVPEFEDKAKQVVETIVPKEEIL